jgi:hypothetical protein
MSAAKEKNMKSILKALEVQRWDDHRYYHHSRINQSLHFVSASSFLCAYALLFFQPVLATLIGWFVAMTAPVRTLLLRAEGLRPRQPGDARVQGADQGRL